MENSDSPNWIEQLFQPRYIEIPDNIKIRPELNTKDLRLIRRAFTLLPKYQEIPTDARDAEQLLYRVLRKVKKNP